MEERQVQLKARAVSLEKKVTSLSESEFPSHCFRNPMTGKWEHGERCNVREWEFFDVKCPEEELDVTESEIDRIKLRDLLTLCFDRPQNAEGQATLEHGMVQFSPIYGISDIKPPLAFKPRAVEHRFRALLVEEASRVDVQVGSSGPLLITLIMLFICAAFGKSSWEVVFCCSKLVCHA